MWALESALFKTKSICRALFSAVVLMCRPKLRYNIIHLFNRYGAQPFLRRKRTSWNVSLSPMGFFQNFNCMSMGHHFKGKNAFPLMSLNIHCHLRFETCTITQREIYILIYPFFEHPKSDYGLSGIRNEEYSLSWALWGIHNFKTPNYERKTAKCTYIKKKCFSTLSV